jgi:hypothetical protein
MNLFLILVLWFFVSFSEASCEGDIHYTPFQPKNKQIPTNSIYGTGNKITDVVYRASCKALCKKNYIREFPNYCCSGESLETLKCNTMDYCNILRGYINEFLISIVFTSYISLILITMLVIFLIYYFLSKRTLQRSSTKQCILNGLVASTIVLFTGLILPIIILKITSIYMKKSMTSILGGEFKEINPTNLIMSVEVRNDDKKGKYTIMEDQKEASGRIIQTNRDKDSQSERKEINIISPTVPLQFKHLHN